MSEALETTPSEDVIDADEEVSTPETDTDETEASDEGSDEDVSDDADQADEESDDEGDGLEEVEFEGVKARIPAAFKAALMRERDYTQKTQAVAETRKELEARQAELSQQAEAIQQLSEDRVNLAVVERQLAAFKELDWTKLEEEDPDEANRLFRQQQRLRERRDDLAKTVETKQNELALTRKRDADQAHAKAVEDCVAVLSRDIKGWSPELAGKLETFATKELGYSPRELVGITDPKFYKTIHAAYLGRQAQQRLKTQTKLTNADKTEPVKKPGAASGGASRRTTDASGDRLSTAEWMRQEQERVARLRR